MGRAVAIFTLEGSHVREARRHRLQKPPDGSVGEYHCQGAPQWPAHCLRPVRAHQHLGVVLPEQAEVPDKLRKRTNTNPAHGPYHFRAPARIFHRVIRGMVPHKTHRGKCAMERLKCFEGIPEEYATKKRVVVPDAFRVTRLKPGRRFCVLGRISNEIGWKHGETVKRLEKKKKAAAVSAGPGADVLAKFGY